MADRLDVVHSPNGTMGNAQRRPWQYPVQIAPQQAHEFLEWSGVLLNRLSTAIPLKLQGFNPNHAFRIGAAEKSWCHRLSAAGSPDWK